MTQFRTRTIRPGAPGGILLTEDKGVPVLIRNLSHTVTVYLADDQSVDVVNVVQSTPLPPRQTVALNGNIDTYANIPSTALGPISVCIYPYATGYFEP